MTGLISYDSTEAATCGQTEQFPKYGEMVQLSTRAGKNYFITLKPDKVFNNHHGVLPHATVVQTPYGHSVETNKGNSYFVLQPDLEDTMKCVSRQTQITYPKDAGRILFKLAVKNGSRVIEAGSGSGAMSIAFATAVGPEGKLYSYDIKKEPQRHARYNVARADLDARVTFHLQNISQGFEENDVDAIFLDVREPWVYFEQVVESLRMGGFLGILVPTVNQIEKILERLEPLGFSQITVEENFQRYWKPVASRLRPVDNMVAHTTFLVFARRVKLYGGG